MSIQIGPFTVERGPILPHKRKSTTTQQVDKSENGSVGVSEKHYDDDIIHVVIRADLLTCYDIYHWIKNGVRYSSQPFAYTDENSVARTVRYWKKSVEYSVIGGDLGQMELPLRKEVYAP